MLWFFRLFFPEQTAQTFQKIACSPSFHSVRMLLISHSFGLLSSATGSSRPQLPRLRRSGSIYLYKIKKEHYIVFLFCAEMEGFEPSRRLPDLYP